MVIADRMQYHAFQWSHGQFRHHQLVRYYRALYDDDFKLPGDHTNSQHDNHPALLDQWSRQAASTVQQILEPVLKSNLVLHKYKSGRDEASRFANYFLCADVLDEDLPWDQTQVDW